MAGRVLRVGPIYTYRKDKDKQGFFFWIVDPRGNLIAYVNEEYMARALVAHLNRS